MADTFPRITANLLSANTPKTPGDRRILLIGGMVSGRPGQEQAEAGIRVSGRTAGEEHRRASAGL